MKKRVTFDIETQLVTPELGEPVILVMVDGFARGQLCTMAAWPRNYRFIDVPHMREIARAEIAGLHINEIYCDEILELPTWSLKPSPMRLAAVKREATKFQVGDFINTDYVRGELLLLSLLYKHKTEGPQVPRLDDQIWGPAPTTGGGLCKQKRSKTP